MKRGITLENIAGEGIRVYPIDTLVPKPDAGIVTVDNSWISRGNIFQNISVLVRYENGRLVVAKSIVDELESWKTDDREIAGKRDRIIEFISSNKVIDLDELVMHDMRAREKLGAMYALEKTLAKSIAYDDVMSNFNGLYEACRQIVADFNRDRIHKNGELRKKPREYLLDRIFDYRPESRHSWTLTKGEMGVYEFVIRELPNSLRSSVEREIRKANEQNGHYTCSPWDDDLAKYWRSSYNIHLRTMFRYMIHYALDNLATDLARQIMVAKFDKSARNDIQVAMLPLVIVGNGEAAIYHNDADIQQILALSKLTRKKEHRSIESYVL